jgi:hypothetical protein
MVYNLSKKGFSFSLLIFPEKSLYLNIQPTASTYSLPGDIRAHIRGEK